MTSQSHLWYLPEIDKLVEVHISLIQAFNGETNRAMVCLLKYFDCDNAIYIGAI